MHLWLLEYRVHWSWIDTLRGIERRVALQIYLIKWAIMGGNRLTPECLIMDLG
jgi:hypothetical protein